MSLEPPAQPPAGDESKKHAPVRRIALEMLMEAEASGRFVDEILAERMEGLAARDRHLLQEIVYGALRHRNTLDHLLDFYLKLPAAHQERPVRWALRVGTYQLVYLERIPAHAALDSTIEAFKSLAQAASGKIGFVNAVLRRMAGDVRHKSEERPSDPDDPTVLPVRHGYCHFVRPVLPLYRLEALGHLSIKYSHPIWLLSRWRDRFGEEAVRQLCQANNATREITARVTKLAGSREALLAALEKEGWQATEGRLADSVVIRPTGEIGLSETFQKGWFRIQDETAIQIGGVLNPPPGARVLDLCSAPGGKAAQILERLGPEGHLVAADLSEARLSLVRESLDPLGTNFRTQVVPEDPRQIDLGESFTHILVDAPCSNTGVLSRRPEARWRIRPEHLGRLSQLQLELLDAALRHLAPGGRVLYATCSIEPEENEDVVAETFARHAGLAELETRLFLPHQTSGDGGFYSLLLKPR